MAASGTHPRHTTTTPSAAPVGPEPVAPRHSPKRRQVFRLALMGSALPSRKPLSESPADFATCAPNFEKLGQGRRARQDIVRESESTTKCGDSGEESCGGCVSIRHPSGIRKAAGGVAGSFSPTCEFPGPPTGLGAVWNLRRSVGPPVPGRSGQVTELSQWRGFLADSE
jgi:hypothetical protein